MDDIDTLTAIQHLVDFNQEIFQQAYEEEDLQQEKNKHAMRYLGENLCFLWQNKGIISTFTKRYGQFSFPDNLDYFFDKVEQVMDDDYIPSDEDFLKIRIRTTGLNTFEYEEGPRSPIIHFLDVGEQRNERIKWMHHFKDVAAIMFVAALSDFAAVKCQFNCNV